MWIWAAVGAVAVALQLWVWVRFLASGPEQLTRYRDSSAAAWKWARVFELAQAGWFVATVTIVGRDALRKRRFTPNAMWLVAFASIVWLDPLLNYLRPGFYFTSNYTNVESWVSWIPGQQAAFASLTLVELIAAPGFWVACATLVFCAGQWGRCDFTLARQLALVGFVNVMFLALPLGITQIGPLRSDPFPTGYPAHLHGGWCGDDGQPYGPCPGSRP